MVDLNQLSESQILALTIIGEARGEPIEGQVAVGMVIRNRFYSQTKKYLTYHDVVLERYQFSCWNGDDPNRKVLEELAERMINNEPLGDAHMRQCQVVAQAVIDWDFIDNVHGAKNYMTKSLFYSDKKPHWAKQPKQLYERGNQVFLVL